MYLYLALALAACGSSTISGSADGPLGSVDGQTDSPMGLDAPPLTDGPSRIDCSPDLRYTYQAVDAFATETTPIFVSPVFTTFTVDPLFTDEFIPNYYDVCSPDSDSVRIDDGPRRHLHHRPMTGAHVGVPRVQLFTVEQHDDLLNALGNPSSGNRIVIFEARMFTGSDAVGPPAVGATYNGGLASAVKDSTGEWISGTTITANSAYVAVVAEENQTTLSDPPGTTCVEGPTANVTGSLTTLVQKTKYCREN